MDASHFLSSSSILSTANSRLLSGIGTMRHLRLTMTLHNSPRSSLAFPPHTTRITLQSSVKPRIPSHPSNPTHDPTNHTGKQPHHLTPTKDRFNGTLRHNHILRHLVRRRKNQTIDQGAESHKAGLGQGRTPAFEVGETFLLEKDLDVGDGSWGAASWDE